MRGRGLLALVLGACTPDPSADVVLPPLTQAEASEQVTFASTEQLGPHRFLATIRRVEERAGREVSQHEEVVDIRWESWDRFSHRRLVDGKPVSESVVVDGSAWRRRQGGRWEEGADAETDRQQLRLTWNAWEQAVGPFGDRVILTREGLETVEGRRAIRYAVSLAPSVAEQLQQGADGPRRRRPTSSFAPTALSGSLWVDEATAVRLTGQVTGTLERGDYKRVTSLQLARTSIGAAQDIEPPEVGEGTSP